MIAKKQGRIFLFFILLLTFLMAALSVSASEELDKSPSQSKETTSSFRECQSGHFFYKQLTTSQEKEIYAVLERHLISDRRISRTGEITFKEPLMLGMKVKGNEDAKDNNDALWNLVTVHLQRGVDAFKFDHPEVYWSSGATAISDIRIGVTDKEEAAVIAVVVNFEPLAKVENDDAAIKAVIDKIVKEAEKSDDDYTRLKMVHDMLAKQITYVSGTTIPMRAFQISGGLVDKKGVCEAYAKSFKLIAERLGYTTILVAGNAENDGEYVPHMWNYVKLSGKWYGVDVTFDDQTRVIHDYFLVGSNSKSQNFGGTMFKDTHKPNGVFHPVKYQSFKYPKLSETGYK